jgi:hypothetical protein
MPFAYRIYNGVFLKFYAGAAVLAGAFFGVVQSFIGWVQLAILLKTP